MEVPKRERLNEFFRRLLDAPAVGTADEALQQLATLMTAVEDERMGVPSMPQNCAKTGACIPHRWTACVQYSGILGYSVFVPRATTSSSVRMGRCRLLRRMELSSSKNPALTGVACGN